MSTENSVIPLHNFPMDSVPHKVILREFVPYRTAQKYLPLLKCDSPSLRFLFLGAKVVIHIIVSM